MRAVDARQARTRHLKSRQIASQPAGRDRAQRRKHGGGKQHRARPCQRHARSKGETSIRSPPSSMPWRPAADQTSTSSQLRRKIPVYEDPQDVQPPLWRDARRAGKRRLRQRRAPPTSLLFSFCLCFKAVSHINVLILLLRYHVEQSGSATRALAPPCSDRGVPYLALARCLASAR